MDDAIYALNAECDAMQDEIVRLEAENAKLRKFAKIDTEDIDTMSCLVDDLRAENDRLRELVNSYADLFEKEAATNNGNGPYYSGEDWLALANDMRIELAKCCGELGIEVDG